MLIERPQPSQSGHDSGRVPGSVHRNPPPCASLDLYPGHGGEQVAYFIFFVQINFPPQPSNVEIQCVQTSEMEK